MATDRSSWGSADAYTIEAVVAAGEAERAAKQHLEEATAALADLMLRMHRLGATWQQLADAAGLANAENARWRAQHAREPGDLPPSLARAFRRPDAAVKTARDASGQPGVSMVRAAEILGVSRQTVYNRIEAGTLPVGIGPDGKRRVLIDSDGTPLE